MKFVANMVLLVLLLPSCQKDKLEGSAAALVGKWKWEYTIEFKQGNFPTEITIIPASNYNTEYFMRFDQSGYFEFLEEENIQERYNIRFSYLDSVPSIKYPIAFSAIMNGDADLSISGAFSEDSMHCFRQPLPYPKEQSAGSVSYSYNNYYSKIK